MALPARPVVCFQSKLRSSMQDTTNEKTSDRIVSPGVGWTILLSLTFGLTLTWWTSLFLMMVGHDLPTGKIVFGSSAH